MATAEKRTLSIEAKLHDLMTRPLSNMERGLRAFARGSSTVLRGAVGSILNLKTAVLGLVGAYGGLAVLGKIRTFGEQADQLLKLADSTGDTVENLSELQAAFELAGLKGEGFASLLRALVNAEKKAVDGNEDMVDAFAALGITLKDLQTLGPAQVFERMAEGLAQFGTEQQRALALSRILPRQFLDLLPILGKGLTQFQGAIVDAREAGATITRSQAEVAERLNDAFTKLQIAMRGVSLALIEAFGPRTIAILERLAKEITANRDGILEVAEAIGKGIVGAVNLAIDALIGFVRMIESIPFVSLIDKPKLEREISVLQSQLLLLEEARSGASSKRLGGRRLADSSNVAPAQRKAFIDDVMAAFEVETKGRQKVIDALAPREEELRERIGVLRRVMSEGIADGMQAMRESFARQLSTAAEAIVAKPHTPEETATALGMPTPEDWSVYADAFGAAMKKRAESAKQEVQSVFATPAGGGAQNAISDQLSLKDLSNESREFVAELAKVVPGLDALRRKLIETQLAADTLRLEKLAKEGVLNVQELAAALEHLKRKAEEAKGKVVELENSVSGGLKQSFEQLMDDLKNFDRTLGRAIGDLAVQSIDSLSNSIADVITGAKSAKEAFKDFAKQFLSDLARMITKMLIYKALQTLFFPAETGGVLPEMEDGGVLQRFATGGVNRNGGIARRPTVLFGEGRTAEAFVPLPDNRSIPVTFIGGNGPGGGNVFNININAMDSRDVGRVLFEQQNTLRSIWSNQLETRHGMRQVVRRAAS